MIRYILLSSIALLTILFTGCTSSNKETSNATSYADTAFMQDYSVKYFLDYPDASLLKASVDRNGKVQVLTNKGLAHLHDGSFLYPGKIVADNSYRFLVDKSIVDMTTVKNQFVFLDKEVIFSNAWAGKLHSKHELAKAKLFEGNDNLIFLVSDGKNVHLVQNNSITWKGAVEEGEIKQIINHSLNDNSFLLLSSAGVFHFSANTKKLEKIYQGENLSAFDLDIKSNNLIVGSDKGYVVYDLKGRKQVGERHDKLPWQEITSVKVLDGKYWFGTPRGAFAVHKNGEIEYYASERWLPNDEVLQINKGNGSTILVLTTNGLSEIRFDPMTLHDKAVFYEKQVRDRHIRNGFNATLSGMDNGNLSTGYMKDSDNDGLWTSLYLASQGFRYAVTKEEEALQNVFESLEAMERLFTIHTVHGFPARSFERNGHIEKLADPERWQQAPDKEWTWKATTSSDEAIGHIFAYGVLAELIENEDIKTRAIALIDLMMDHIVKNDLYLVDFDGKPTLWGKWNPEYVNSFPTNIGDRKLNSSNIIAMLQTAYHFTKKEIYKEKAFELMDGHGYLENLMRPMKKIGEAENEADDWSKHLSSAWNHSDDEMYFAGYWGLYRYALNDTLKAKFKETILDHWEFERPEKEGAWNIFTAITGTKKFDLNEAVWYLKKYPLDLVKWTVENSHRKDIDLLAPNFRDQSTKEVLPPDELKISRHNGNRFNLDGGNDGREENSAGDIWLFPYWMARYLHIIEAPVLK